MTAEEFLKTIWICEPPKGHLEVKHVVEAMEQYATLRVKQEKIRLLEKLQGIAGIKSDQIIYRELKNLKDE